MGLITLLFLWTFVLFFTKINSLQSCQSLQPKNLNKQLQGYKLFDRIVISHHECAKECMRLGACASINFITSTKSCEFNSAGSEKVLSNAKGIIFSDISEWPKAMVRGCAYHDCNKIQRCLPLGPDSYKCVNIMCKSPPNSEQSVAEHATVVAGTTVQSHACPDGMFLSGDKHITCNVNGEWTVPKATCQDSTIGKSCSSNSDCKETGAVCKDEICYCSHFFRRDTESKDCIKVCSTMDSTFSVMKGLIIVNRNDLGIQEGISIDECFTMCSEDKNCMSFEFNTADLKCRRSTYTKQMVEDAIPTDIKLSTSELHVRNCF